TFLIFQLGRLDVALPCADAADAAKAALRIAGRALLIDQPALAILVLDKARRPIAVLRIGVFVPQVERLEDMAVRIDDVVGATHNQLPSCQWSTLGCHCERSEAISGDRAHHRLRLLRRLRLLAMTTLAWVACCTRNDDSPGG